MFEKKCLRCGRKISRDFEFCPYCGFNIKGEREEKDFGFLGKKDDFKFPSFGVKMPFGFNGLFNSLLKQVDMQFKDLDKEIGREIKEEKNFKKPPFRIPINAKGISVSISTGTGKKPEINIRGFGPGFENLLKLPKEVKEKKFKQRKISEEKAREIAKLPKEEAETKVRRLGNKVVYEINLPEVKKLDDIVINKLENSIEIKAISEKKVYFKLLPVKLPILDYKLKDEKLILELRG